MAERRRESIREQEHRQRRMRKRWVAEQERRERHRVSRFLAELRHVGADYDEREVQHVN